MNKINTFDIKELSFTYAGGEEPSLGNVNFSVKYGEFITLCGKTGSGKSTLLRNMKTVLSPEGDRKGSIEFYGRRLDDVSEEEQARRIGFVMQDPENQIVTDKVWHELAFGLENLGVETNSIRTRVAEIATFFGIAPWINRDIAGLSGGQKQLLNLASVMAMSPDILILDEPTAALDPVASEEFIDTLIKINREIGTTVIISEHNLNQVMPLSDRVIILEKGGIMADGSPGHIGEVVTSDAKELILSMPVPLQIYTKLKDHTGSDGKSPLTVREGRAWLTKIFAGRTLTHLTAREDPGLISTVSEDGFMLKDIRFKYERRGEDVLRGLDMKIGRGIITAVVGGNGAGKSTLLRIIAGILKPYKGKSGLPDSKIVLLPQDPQTLFIGESVEKELMAISNDPEKIAEAAALMDLNDFMERHAYDLSGGEQQRVAFAKILLTEGDVFLLDEPTTGLDGGSKRKLGELLKDLSKQGKTIIMVTHDLEFSAEYADNCQLLFDGQIMSSGTPMKFFSDNSYYTTAGNRMSRHIFKFAVTPGDVADLCRINLEVD